MATTSSRMLTLLSLLQARRDWPGPVLAERLDVSERTVRRDVDRLRELGYRIGAVRGPDGGYRLDAGSELPPLLFDDDQAVAVALALRSAATPGAGFEEAALRALTTVRQVMPSRLRHRIDTLQVTTMAAPVAGPGDAVDPEVLVGLGDAVRAREVVRFDHAGASGAHGDDATVPAPPRRVEPHHLVTRAGRWYLVGWSLDRDAWRIWRVDRLTLRTHRGPRFEPREVPGGDVAAFVAGRFKGSDGADVWPCRGEVLLSLPASEVAPYVGVGEVEAVDAGRCRLRAGAWSWQGLAASVGRFGADVEVVGPPELRAAFGELAARFAAAASERVSDRGGRSCIRS